MFQSRIVATDLGSLPAGGVEQNTPIYAVENDFLESESQTPSALVDLSWGPYQAFFIDNVLTPSECAHLINFTEALGFRAAAPGIQTPPGMRENKTVHWIAQASQMEQLYRRVEPQLPATIDGRALGGGLSHRINTYRYTAGERFRPHVDGDWPGFGLTADRQGMEMWAEGRSMLSMLLYLNGVEEGVEGGDTLLIEVDGRPVHRITPKAGRALFFRHGIHSRSVLHAGDSVSGDTPKYVARINVMYEE